MGRASALAYHILLAHGEAVKCPDHARYLSECISCNLHRDTPGCPNCDADLPNLTAALTRAETAEAERDRLRNDVSAVSTQLAITRQIATEKADEVARLRAAIEEQIQDWKEQASADESGWSYRRGNNEFNAGAAFVLRHYEGALADILKGGAP